MYNDITTVNITVVFEKIRRKMYYLVLINIIIAFMKIKFNAFCKNLLQGGYNIYGK
jgi:hypothetical protein